MVLGQHALPDRADDLFQDFSQIKRLKLQFQSA